MSFPRLTRFLPNWTNALFSIASAILLILAFPDFEYWFLAWFALVPLFWAIESEKASAAKSFVLGWLFGTIFFFGTCWWLTFAPITYASFPPTLAYFLMLCVAVMVGIFPAIFAAIFSILLKRFGSVAILSAPFIWVFTEFLRYWLTGNNWNAIGYSQAFGGVGVAYASLGGIYVVSFVILAFQSLGIYLVRKRRAYSRDGQPITDFQSLALASKRLRLLCLVIWIAFVSFLLIPSAFKTWDASVPYSVPSGSALVIAVQPNIPMAGLTLEKWRALRQRHEILGESAVASNLSKFEADAAGPLSTEEDREIYSQIVRKRINVFPKIVIFPESPMNFEYDADPEFQEFINRFAAKNNVSVLFNSAEPDTRNGKFFNSAVMVSPEGREVAQYDKIYLLPFGESVPALLQSIVPAFVGSFSYGNEYDLLPLGDAKAGVMICFESHFGQLSREYVRNGADVLIEMTNDGYLGPTPVLRQHLANAVFRAVETNRPVLRVTNVGITAYINEKGEVLDPATPYQEDTRIWSVSKSDGSQTFYVKYGDWFAWLCSIVTVGLLIFGFVRGKRDA
jgi:apolipoprotein N-acyltransferase